MSSTYLWRKHSPPPPAAAATTGTAAAAAAAAADNLKSEVTNAAAAAAAAITDLCCIGPGSPTLNLTRKRLFVVEEPEADRHEESP
jgi:hypothetical protein